MTAKKSTCIKKYLLSSVRMHCRCPVFIFWYSAELPTPLLIKIAFIIGIVLEYLACGVAGRFIGDCCNLCRQIAVTITWVR